MTLQQDLSQSLIPDVRFINAENFPDEPSLREHITRHPARIATIIFEDSP